MLSYTLKRTQCFREDSTECSLDLKMENNFPESGFFVSRKNSKYRRRR